MAWVALSGLFLTLFVEVSMFDPRERCLLRGGSAVQQAKVLKRAAARLAQVGILPMAAHLSRLSSSLARRPKPMCPFHVEQTIIGNPPETIS